MLIGDFEDGEDCEDCEDCEDGESGCDRIFYHGTVQSHIPLTFYHRIMIGYSYTRFQHWRDTVKGLTILGLLSACTLTSNDLDKSDTGLVDTGEEGDVTDSQDTTDTTDTTDTQDTDPSFEDNPVYIGGYNTDRCENGFSSTGLGIGDISTDFEVMDQHGEMIRLSDFCDNTVLLVSAAFW